MLHVLANSQYSSASSVTDWRDFYADMILQDELIIRLSVSVCDEFPDQQHRML